MGEKAAAIVDHDRALELDPTDATAHNHLAWMLATSPDAPFTAPSVWLLRVGWRNLTSRPAKD